MTDSDPAVGLQLRQDFQEAMAELKQLPKPMQEVVLVASQVRRHRDVGEILDIPETRVGYLLASAGAALGEAAERRTDANGQWHRRARHACANSRTPRPMARGSGRPPADQRQERERVDPGLAPRGARDRRLPPRPRLDLPPRGTRPKTDRHLVARRAHERAQQAIDRLGDERARRGNRLER